MLERLARQQAALAGACPPVREVRGARGTCSSVDGPCLGGSIGWCAKHRHCGQRHPMGGEHHAPCRKAMRDLTSSQRNGPSLPGQITLTKPLPKKRRRCWDVFWGAKLAANGLQ